MRTVLTALALITMLAAPAVLYWTGLWLIVGLAATVVIPLWAITRRERHHHEDY